MAKHTSFRHSSHNRNITRRWILNSLSIILLALTVVSIVLTFSMRQYYYTQVESFLTFTANSVEISFNRLLENSHINESAVIRSEVENFEQRDKIEMMAIDYQGEIAITSSGFSYYESHAMPDYEQALTEGQGFFVGKHPATNEKIMAVCIATPSLQSEFSALRYVVSLEEVDRVVFLINCSIVIVMIIILVLIIFSSSYFIRSIVIPVQEISNVARKLADGNMNERILKKTDDEIGDLCDVINYMADAIQESEAIKNDFISSVSHELRTPLTAIKGWGETLITMEENDTEMIQKGMRVILNETDRLSDMVEELLDFSRIQSGQFASDMAKIDVLAELEEVVLIYTERANRENIPLIFHEPEQLPYMMGDRNRLKQVFINIIDNALKYSDPGDTVTVTADTDTDTGDILLIIEDTGCGIAPEDLAKVTEKFYKANFSRRGSGIGLAVVNDIIQMHGGKMTIESELEVGTRVIIRFPSVS